MIFMNTGVKVTVCIPLSVLWGVQQRCARWTWSDCAVTPGALPSGPPCTCPAAVCQVPTSPHPHQRVLLSAWVLLFLFDDSILTGRKCSSRVLTGHLSTVIGEMSLSGPGPLLGRAVGRMTLCISMTAKASLVTQLLLSIRPITPQQLLLAETCKDPKQLNERLSGGIGETPQA